MHQQQHQEQMHHHTFMVSINILLFLPLLITNKSQEEEQINNKNDDDERCDRGKRSASQGHDQIAIKDKDSRMNMRRIMNYSNVSNIKRSQIKIVMKVK